MKDKMLFLLMSVCVGAQCVDSFRVVAERVSVHSTLCWLSRLRSIVSEFPDKALDTRIVSYKDTCYEMV